MSDIPSDPSDSSSSSESDPFEIHTPPNLHQNTSDPAALWLVQKFGGTSVGKFIRGIAEQVIPQYLDQHRVAIVCSARSGSTKALGTTNLLIKAAEQAVPSKRHGRTGVPGTPGSPGTTTPFSVFWGRSEGTKTEGIKSSPPSSPTRTRTGSESLLATSLNNLVNSGTQSQPAFVRTVDLIKSEHLEAARAHIKDQEILKELESEIENDCEGLKSFLSAVQVIDEISPRSKDSIIGVGERLACKLVAAVLRDSGIDSEFVSLENIAPPLEPDQEIDELAPEGSLPQEWYDSLAETIAERVKSCDQRVPVVTGFFSPVPNSLLTTVGRGYTDLCAALLAAGLGASELQIWKEVDGIFTADPNKVPTARLLPTISPEEAAELTFFGSEVVHPFTMEQVMRRGIPIRIKNVKNPSGSGTVILPKSYSRGKQLDKSSSPPVEQPWEKKRLPTAVTYKDNIVVLNVHSNRKTFSHGFLARIFAVLDRFGVVVDLISTSEVHVSMAIQMILDETSGSSSGRGKLDRLLRELRKVGTVSIHHDMAILSLVGSQMASLIGISGLFFTTLGDGGVNIEMISQGASEINISCVIKGRDAVKALNLVHQSCLQIRPEGAKGRVGPWLF